jgi:hypothetical protein
MTVKPSPDDPRQVELAAKALYASWSGFVDLKGRRAWELRDAKTRDYFRTHARAVLQALAQA